MFEQESTQEIASDLSEVFDWSALEILSAPYFPILFPVVFDRNLQKITHRKYQAT